MNRPLLLESPTLIGYSSDWMEQIQPLNTAEKKSQGYVSLVGAGPNDPDLLTLKALKALQKAQVLVYDRLVGKEILALANPKAEQVYVGKRCGQPSMKQETICALLVKYAQAGKN